MSVTTVPAAGAAATPAPVPGGRLLMNVHLATGLALVFALMAVGLLMRMSQAGWLALDPGWFYSLMTLHGAGMIAALVLCGMGGVWYLVSRDAAMNVRTGWWAYGTIMAGIVLVLAATMIGNFAAAWTFLHPLPFVNPAWPFWSTGAFLFGIMLITAGWTVWSFQILEAVLRRFGGLRGALGLDLVFRPRAFREAGREPPPAHILPAAVISIDGLIMATAGMLIGVSLIVHWLDPRVALDPLWAKNLTYFFGHSLANYIIYMLLAFVYVGLPRFTGRKWKTNAVFVIGWWGTMLFLILAYLHHLYLDFAQPEPLQVLGQIGSYLSAVPVAVVTVYGAILLVWRSGMRWSLGAIFMYTGLAGWITGGTGALLDATVPFNTVLHNTLWVPAHFHNYLLGASLFFAVGWVFQRLEERSSSATPAARRWFISLTVFGGTALFLLAFYAGGAAGIPRRFATAHEPSASLAGWGSVGAIILMLGLAAGFFEGMRLWRTRRPAAADARAGGGAAQDQPGTAPFRSES